MRAAGQWQAQAQLAPPRAVRRRAAGGPHPAAPALSHAAAESTARTWGRAGSGGLQHKIKLQHIIHRPLYYNKTLPAQSRTITVHDADTAVPQAAEHEARMSGSPNLVRQSEHITPFPAPGAGHQVMHGVDINVAQLCPFCRAQT